MHVGGSNVSVVLVSTVARCAIAALPPLPPHRSNSVLLAANDSVIIFAYHEAETRADEPLAVWSHVLRTIRPLN